MNREQHVVADDETQEKRVMFLRKLVVIGAVLLTGACGGPQPSPAPPAPKESQAAQPGGQPAATVPSNPDRDCFFGQTHSHTSWSLDAYLIGNHITAPEDAYKYSLGLPVKHPAASRCSSKAARSTSRA